MKKFLRKLKARWTGIYPCSFDSLHGHDVDLPSIFLKHNDTVGCFRCKVCNGVLIYEKFFGAYTDFISRTPDERWEGERD